GMSGRGGQDDEDPEGNGNRARPPPRAPRALGPGHGGGGEVPARGVGGRNPTVVELARDGRVQSRRGWIVGDEPVRIFAEALEPPIPDVAVDVGGEARRLDEQRHAPEGAEDEAEREAASPRSADAPEESEREKVTAAGDDRPGDEEARSLPHFDEGEREHGDRDHAAAREKTVHRALRSGRRARS